MTFPLLFYKPVYVFAWRVDHCPRQHSFKKEEPDELVLAPIENKTETTGERTENPSIIIIQCFYYHETSNTLKLEIKTVTLF